MSVSLAQFIRQQLALQGLPVKTFAERAGLGLSHAYQLYNGERPRPSGDTLDAVARGLNMTPAEMAKAMGRDSTDSDPDEAHMLALFRQVPTERRPAAFLVIRGLAVEPTRRANSRPDATAKRLARKAQQLGKTSEQHGNTGVDEGLTETSGVFEACAA